MRTRTGRIPADVARDPQHAELGIGIEAVAGLDLQRGHAFGDQGVDTGKRRGEQRGVVGRAGGAHRRHDAAAGAGDLLVAAPSSRSSNSRARSPPKTTWVWQSISAGVTSRPPRSRTGRPAGVGERGLRPDPGDAPGADRDGGRGKQPVGRPARLHRRDGGVSDQEIKAFQSDSPVSDFVLTGK